MVIGGESEKGSTMPTSRGPGKLTTTGNPGSSADAMLLGEIKGTLNGLVQTVQDHIQEQDRRWDSLQTWKDMINQRIFQVEAKGDPGEKAKSDSDNDLGKRAVTWQWIGDKLFGPIATAVLIWFVLYGIPAIQAAIQRLAQQVP